MASGQSSAAMNKIERAHQMYREGCYDEALCLYTQALGMAKTRPQKIALHSNRAACFLKMHDFRKATEECTSVLELDHNHTGALMLRAQTLVTLKEYRSALFDVNRLMELNPSSEVYQNLQACLKTQLSLAPIPEVEAELEDGDEDKDEAASTRNEEVQEVKDLVCSKEGRDQTHGCKRNPCGEVSPSHSLSIKESSSPERNSRGWQAIPKPKGHSQLDYSRWDKVEDESSEEYEDDDEEEDEECQSRYRFRVRTVGVRPVK